MALYVRKNLYVFLYFIYLCNILFYKYYECVGFEVLTAVVVKSSAFWDITLSISLEIN
jgi:hypothetical protein